jgi:hypothetical protein
LNPPEQAIQVAKTAGGDEFTPVEMRFANEVSAKKRLGKRKNTRCP